MEENVSLVMYCSIIEQNSDYKHNKVVHEIRNILFSDTYSLIYCDPVRPGSILYQ